ncbi:MAG: GNAT family N-acetyltransferase, partial [Acidobacteria bacterium]|nr:GNAT family N-acetyltransferase [Acidobacteriota bacterium]
MLANAGDHATIHQFLTVVFQGPSHDMFLASLDDPFYEPSDRLLIKRGHQILAHLHLTRRSMRFRSCRFPASDLGWLGTLSEFRGRGFAGQLMQTAQRLMVEEGAQIAWMRTSIPHYFRRFGWAVCGRHCHSRVSTRDLLPHLASSPGRRRVAALNVRPWRQVELQALMRLYHDNVR